MRPRMGPDAERRKARGAHFGADAAHEAPPRVEPALAHRPVVELRSLHVRRRADGANPPPRTAA